MADHFRGNVEPLGYKAFWWGGSGSVRLYKKALDKYLPDRILGGGLYVAHNDRNF